MSRLAETPVSPRQQQALDLLRDKFGGAITATIENYRRIAAEFGWKDYNGVKDVLFALRAKGRVRSIGGTNARPERWEVEA